MWYNDQRTDLARRFSDDLFNSLIRIKTHPKMYAAGFCGTRKCPLQIFPYYVVYRVEKRRLDVIAIVHASRRSSVWTSRIS
jgi:plasmid stabilization system protein ParE